MCVCHNILTRCIITNHVLVIFDHSPVYRVTVPYAACIQCILLKMSIYGSKHVEE